MFGTRPRNYQLLLLLPILHFSVPVSDSWGGETRPRVELKKIPHSTAIVVTLEGEMDVPQAAVQAVLCDYEAHGRFQEITERVAILSAQEAQAFQASKPKDRSAVKPQVVPGKHRGACPGSAFVLTLMDFPFPISDGWSLYKYESGVSGTTFQMKFDTVVGSEKGSGSWTVTPLSETRSRLLMVTNYDMGVALPGFLMKWAVNSQMPAMFKAIEREAQKRVPK